MGKRILCFGDSNTWGLNPKTGSRHDESVRWTGILKDKFPEYTIIEEGMNGRTSAFDDALTPGANGLKYLTPCIISQAPLDMVIISVGTNDLKLNVCGTAGGSSIGVGMLINETRKLLGKDIPILVICPIYIGYERKELGPLKVLGESCYEQSRMFPLFFSALATDYGCYYLNTQDCVRPSSVDGVHMDEENHRILAEKIAEKINEIL